MTRNFTFKILIIRIFSEIEKSKVDSDSDLDLHYGVTRLFVRLKLIFLGRS